MQVIVVSIGFSLRVKKPYKLERDLSMLTVLAEPKSAVAKSTHLSSGWYESFSFTKTFSAPQSVHFKLCLQVFQTVRL